MQKKGRKKGLSLNFRKRIEYRLARLRQIRNAVASLDPLFVDLDSRPKRKKMVFATVALFGQMPQTLVASSKMSYKVKIRKRTPLPGVTSIGHGGKYFVVVSLPNKRLQTARMATAEFYINGKLKSYLEDLEDDPPPPLDDKVNILVTPKRVPDWLGLRRTTYVLQLKPDCHFSRFANARLRLVVSLIYHRQRSRRIKVIRYRCKVPETKLFDAYRANKALLRQKNTESLPIVAATCYRCQQIPEEDLDRVRFILADRKFFAPLRNGQLFMGRGKLEGAVAYLPHDTQQSGPAFVAHRREAELPGLLDWLRSSASA